MAKENFLLKKSAIEVFESLSDEDAGKLIKGILRYVNKKDMELSGYLKTIFIPIKQEIDSNEKKYEEICNMRKEIGKLGGAPKGNKNAEKEKTTKRLKKQPKQPKGSKNNQNNLTCHNHIHIHNQDNNKELIGYGEEEKKKKTTNDTSRLGEIVEYLNSKAGTHYRTSTKMTEEKINARLNEGYSLNDFIAVIDNKCADWLGTNMAIYLRPETLFGNKFESYLNEKTTPKKKESQILSNFEENGKKEIATQEEQDEMDKILSSLENGGDKR